MRFLDAASVAAELPVLADVGRRRRWVKAWGLPLRECSWVGHHQGPEGAGMRPVAGIGGNGLSHRG